MQGRPSASPSAEQGHALWAAKEGLSRCGRRILGAAAGNEGLLPSGPGQGVPQARLSFRNARLVRGDTPISQGSHRQVPPGGERASWQRAEGVSGRKAAPLERPQEERWVSAGQAMAGASEGEVWLR